MRQPLTFFAPEVVDGDFLGDYQVLNVLGRGPLGISYHVIHNGLGKEFALKTLPLTESLSLEWLDRLEAQTTLLSKLVFCHIDHIVQSGRSSHLWFCVKDYIHDGEGNSCNLRAFLARHGGRLSHHQVLTIVSQILKALTYAASYEDSQHQGVCHGNLKPENILIGYSLETALKAPFEVKLSDFQPYGLIHQKIVLDSYSQWMDSLSRYSSRLGEHAAFHALTNIYRAYDYLPPEKESESRPMPEGDLFSLGVMIYEMFTGKVPVGRFPSLKQLRPELPEGWDVLVNRCLQTSPERRYPSAEAMQAVLQGLFAGADIDAEEGAEEVLVDVNSTSAAPKERRSLTPRGMIYIPAGSFFVGSGNCGEDALPQHSCTTPGFYMDRTPVTNEQFEQFVAKTGHVTDAERQGEAAVFMNGEWKVLPGISWRNPMGTKLPGDFPRHPVTQVSWADAAAYAKWLGRRLPTEQEWEYAARGGQKDVKYPWGNIISRSQANYASEGTCAVMNYQANGYGLYDMIGNAWEWTSSSYLPYPGNLVANSNFSEQYKVVRGGAWMYDAFHCMISYRNANQPDRPYPTLGFRTLSDPLPSKP